VFNSDNYQAEANIMAGLLLARMNNEFPSVKAVLAGDYSVLDVAPRMRVAISLVPASTKRGYYWTRKLFLPVSVSEHYDAKNGYIHTELELEAECSGPPGVTGNYPDGVPGGDESEACRRILVAQSSGSKVFIMQTKDVTSIPTYGYVGEYGEPTFEGYEYIPPVRYSGNYQDWLQLDPHSKLTGVVYGGQRYLMRCSQFTARVPQWAQILDIESVLEEQPHLYSELTRFRFDPLQSHKGWIVAVVQYVSQFTNPSFAILCTRNYGVTWNITYLPISVIYVDDFVLDPRMWSSTTKPCIFMKCKISEGGSAGYYCIRKYQHNSDHTWTMVKEFRFPVNEELAITIPPMELQSSSWRWALHGGNNLILVTDADAYEVLSPSGTGDIIYVNLTFTPDINVYIARAGGASAPVKLYKGTKSGSTWTWTQLSNIGLSNLTKYHKVVSEPGGGVSCLEYDTEKMFFGLNNVSNGSLLWYSANGGRTWADKTGNLKTLTGETSITLYSICPTKR
jgi:hypothetical protein